MPDLIVVDLSGLAFNGANKTPFTEEWTLPFPYFNGQNIRAYTPGTLGSGGGGSGGSARPSSGQMWPRGNQ